MTTHPSPTLFAVPRSHVDVLPWEAFPAGHHVQTKVLYTSEGVTAGLLRLDPGARELTHLHRDGEHHLWVQSGELIVEGTRLGAGSYVHVPAHLAHTVEDGGYGSTAFYVFCPST